MTVVLAPLVVATIALIVIHRRTRRAGTDLPLVAAIGTGMILGLATVYLGVTVIAVVLGALG